MSVSVPWIGEALRWCTLIVGGAFLAGFTVTCTAIGVLALRDRMRAR